MKHGSLFSGIGGFDLAAQWMGWENVFHCEINPFGQKILKHYWPNAKSYSDIKTTDFSIYRGLLDVLSGGFPCQPYSVAGEQKGTDDDRHLWPHMLRAIQEIQPVDIVGENVPGIVSWNGGVVFEQVCSDLEAEGYEVLPITIPAYAVNADHRRDRVWFIAHSERARLQRHNTIRKDVRMHKRASQPLNSDSYVHAGRNLIEGYSKYIRGGDGLSRGLDKHRVTAMGNAIVPQIAYEIFNVIEQMRA